MLLYLQEIRSQLENCLSDGSPLLVTDCDIKKLASDSRFRHPIQRCGDFINGKQRFKVIVSTKVSLIDLHILLWHVHMYGGART